MTSTATDKSMQLFESDPVDFRFEFEAAAPHQKAEEPTYTSEPSFAAQDDSDQAQFANGSLFASGLNLLTLSANVLQYSDKTESLDLSHNMLTELTNIEKFTRLGTLNLDSNFLTEATKFPQLPNLHTLTLNKNRISDIDLLLGQLQQYGKLTYLSLLGNSACPNELVAKDEEDYQRYRYYVIHSLPNIRFLDSRPVTTEERKVAKETGKFLKVVKFTESDIGSKTPTKPAEAPAFTPLGKSSRSAEQTRASVGTSKYVYYGKHSEGNRFIKDDDL